MGFKIKDFPYELKVGRDINAVSSLAQTISDQDQEFDFILVDVCNSMNYRTSQTIESRPIALTRSDTCIRSYHWHDFILAKINNYLTDLDSNYEHIRLRAEAIFNQEISLAMHLGIYAIVVDFPLGPRIENFARVLNTYFQNVSNGTKFIIRMAVPSIHDEAENLYEKYLQFKQLCGHYAGISIILDLQANLASWDYFLNRFTSDKIFGVQLDQSVFLSNAKGHPVLAKKHQEAVKNLMKQQVKFILRSRHPNDNIDPHYQYLCHLFKTHDQLDEEDKIEISYRNYLQSPLQPLADNLESCTYETFENDKIKYDLYEDSLVKAFLDKKKYGKFFQTMKPTESDDRVMNTSESQEVISVMYFGAGRGPLIRKAIKAAERADVKIRVIALDKNPNAIVTLRNMIIEEKLEDRVELFAGDMRKIQISDLQGDILMSELLGSFGDNELSPECLNPTSKFLKPGGIFIPYSYTNFVVPLSSQIIWNEVNIYASQGLQARVPISQQLYPFELPYVVRIYSANFPCGAKTKEVFTFRHLPYPDQEELKNEPEGEAQSLKRYDRVTFTVEHEQSEIHGFAGYFTAELYQDIFYSTNPEVHTPGMHSWFPMYFPVKDPFIVFKGQELSLSIWRNNSQSKVWYEWSLSVFDHKLGKTVHSTHIHNINGRGFSIGL